MVYPLHSNNEFVLKFETINEKIPIYGQMTKTFLEKK